MVREDNGETVARDWITFTWSNSSRRAKQRASFYFVKSDGTEAVRREGRETRSTTGLGIPDTTGQVNGRGGGSSAAASSPFSSSPPERALPHQSTLVASSSTRSQRKGLNGQARPDELQVCICVIVRLDY